jgi:hypothetical protein
MFSKSQIASILIAFFAVTTVNAHGVITAVKGGNGVTAQAFGVVETTPRDGTKRTPFQVSSYYLINTGLAADITNRWIRPLFATRRLPVAMLKPAAVLLLVG